MIWNGNKNTQMFLFISPYFSFITDLYSYYVPCLSVRHINLPSLPLFLEKLWLSSASTVLPAYVPVHTCAVKLMYVKSEPGVKFSCLYLFKSVLIIRCQSHCEMRSSVNMTFSYSHIIFIKIIEVVILIYH